MGFEGFPKDTLAFLADLADVQNNNKDWFHQNKKRYQEVYVAPAKAFVTAMGDRLVEELSPDLNAVPSAVGGSMMRINRDIRFSKDKRPYKDHMDLWFWEGTGKSKTCPGLGFRMKHDYLGTGGGFHGMEKELLAAYRDRLADDGTGAELADVVQAAEDAGYEAMGKHYKRVPRGYDAEHPRGELMKFKGIWLSVDTGIPDAVHSDELVDVVVERFRPVYPLVRWLTAITEG